MLIFIATTKCRSDIYFWLRSKRRSTQQTVTENSKTVLLNKRKQRPWLISRHDQMSSQFATYTRGRFKLESILYPLFRLSSTSAAFLCQMSWDRKNVDLDDVGVQIYQLINCFHQAVSPAVCRCWKSSLSSGVSFNKTALIPLQGFYANFSPICL